MDLLLKQREICKNNRLNETPVFPRLWDPDVQPWFGGSGPCPAIRDRQSGLLSDRERVEQYLVLSAKLHPFKDSTTTEEEAFYWGFKTPRDTNRLVQWVERELQWILLRKSPVIDILCDLVLGDSPLALESYSLLEFLEDPSDYN